MRMSFFPLFSLLFCLTLVPLRGETLVRIDKTRLTLTLMADGDTLAHYPISCGRGYGHKQRQGDLRTPEGTFTILSFTDARDWGHDFHDGLGFIRHAYGPWFIRLSAGNGIGIHGTHDPTSIGLRATEGCIRLRNDDLAALRPLLRRGMRVEILPERFEPIPCPVVRVARVPCPAPRPLPPVSIPPVE